MALANINFRFKKSHPKLKATQILPMISKNKIMQDRISILNYKCKFIGEVRSQSRNAFNKYEQILSI